MGEGGGIDAFRWSTKRLPELDFLRGVAILLVLGRHLYFIPLSLPWFLWKPLWVWRQVGWVGVDLFFVLSGFLISGLIFREINQSGAFRPIRFLLRRGFKIYPSFYFSLGVISAVSILGMGWPVVTLPGLVQELVFVQNYLVGFDMPTWSLAVEEHYYLLLSLGVVLLSRQGLRVFSQQLPKGIVGILVLVLLFRIGYVSIHPESSNWKALLRQSHFRLDSLIFGSLLSYFVSFYEARTRNFLDRYGRTLGMACGFILLIPLYFSLEEYGLFYAVGFSLLYVAFGGIVLLFTSSRSPFKVFILKFGSPIGWVGKHSYCIYLWHLPVYFWLVRLIPHHAEEERMFYLLLICYLFGSLLLGWVTSVLIEKPFLRLRERVLPSTDGGSVS